MNVRKIREAQGMSMRELARKSGLSYRTVQQAEYRDTCSVTTAIKLADALEVSLDELCRDNFLENF